MSGGVKRPPFRYTGKRVPIGPVKHPRALAEAAIAHIEAHPETWDQLTYSSMCGTKFCFAGHVLNIAKAYWCGYVSDEVEDGNGGRMWVPTAAAYMLGLSYEDGFARFFEQFRTLEDLKRETALLPETQATK